ncbi:protein phosphatase 1 regulatory subunit 12B-like isoform X2 [Mya arenaria]|uniref:protein phosphatase 1 regulatory subunit 12B-like isoform X2 n=1 Tax=Mya arenaria TaxID=6604 RepID=UPI0022E7E1F0|nr:protein phosphatase 1 regulatory subunit 12B-like isoform X2 [Mya arenaria]
MLDHSDLINEMNNVEKMTTPERLKHAKKRRLQQLKGYANYEKQLEKDKNKKNKQAQSLKRAQKKKGRVKFIHNVMLLEAAARNDIEEVRKLLRGGVVPDVTNEDGLTALHQCCIDDSEEMLRLLLEFGANVNAHDSEMWTPLHAAATCGHVHLCKHLIDKGADVLAVNADGNMPYDICEDEVCLDFIETEMAKRGITQEEIDDKRLETERQMLTDMEKIAAKGGNLEFRDIHWATPLHIAAANGYLEVVEFLLNQHVSLEARDEDGWLPIHAAACWLQPEVIELLVKSGCEIDAKTRTGETPFDLAEDPDVKQKILDLKDELESHRASRSKDHIRNRRTISTRGHYSSNGSLYSSNGSLNEQPRSHQHSASIRRTSMRTEKKPLFKKEAQEEAKHFGMISVDQESLNHIDDDENVPATNIDDVRISIIDDEPEKHQKETSEKQTRTDRVDSVKQNKPGPSAQSNTGKPGSKPRDSEHERLSQTRQQNGDKTSQAHTRPESQKPKSVESEKRLSDHSKPEPIHIHMVQTDSGNKANSRSPQQERQQPHDANTQRHSATEKQTEHRSHDTTAKKQSTAEKPTEHRSHDTTAQKHTAAEKKTDHRSHDTTSQKHTAEKQTERSQTGNRGSQSPKLASNPQVRQLQGQGTGVSRSGSFQKKRESQRQRMEQTLETVADGNENGRFPTSNSTGTLADLKKQRSEQYKFGTGTEGMVANLFISSLSGDTKRYSSGPQHSPPSKDKVQNGQSPRSNNNNNTSGGQRQPPTFISDSGALRRFSAPTSSPAVGDDDKFKNDCCVIL